MWIFIAVLCVAGSCGTFREPVADIAACEKRVNEIEATWRNTPPPDSELKALACVRRDPGNPA